MKEVKLARFAYTPSGAFSTISVGAA
ncbi:hypothetical protein LCGC14_2410750, partial [marine sediment metagenome]